MVEGSGFNFCIFALGPIPSDLHPDFATKTNKEESHPCLPPSVKKPFLNLSKVFGPIPSFHLWSYLLDELSALPF